MDFKPKHITAEVPVIGFTGALGSGCTFLAEGLSKHHNYRYYSLSDPIHRLAQQGSLGESVATLQDIGNALRRLHGQDVLVAHALKTADGEWPQGSADKPSGIVLDGIRNTGEVAAIRQWPNFCLVSVHSEQEVRKVRLLSHGRLVSQDDFYRADRRDADEKYVHGQQVKRCNDLADIIIRNDKPIPEHMSDERRQYIYDKLYNKYITLIEEFARGGPVIEHRPSLDEALMTAAYCISRLSSCLKRKVGAVVAREDNGEILSVGYNEVPEGTLSCLADTDLGWCARDIAMEAFGGKLKFCPTCGKKVEIAAKCAQCGTELRQYVRRCPHCNEDPDLVYVCPECKTSVFDEYLLGRTPMAGRLLDVCRAVHAEEAALISLGRVVGSGTRDAVLYTTTFPCALCAKRIAATGIRKVVYAEPYPMPEALEVLRHTKVEVRQFEGVKSAAYFRLYR